MIPQVNQFRVRDFSGGKTDYHVDSNANRAQHMDNLQVEKNRSLKQRPGSIIYDSTNPRLPNSGRVDDLIYFKDQLFQRSGELLYFITGGAFDTLDGPVDTNDALGNATFSGQISYDEWNNHLFITTSDYRRPRKIYKDGSSNFQVRNAGLPALASTPTVTPASAGSTDTYIYYFCHKYTYSVGTVQFVDRGPVTQLAVTANIAIGSSSNAAITAIPVLSNSTTECWDTGSIKVEIYRTADNGTQGKYVGEVTNGTTTFTDDVDDADLGIDVYTFGGVKGNDIAPKSKYITVANDCAWYGATTDESAVVRPQRIQQSKQGDLDSCPGQFYVDVEGDLTSLSSVSDTVIAFTEEKTYRIEGLFSDNGDGSLKARLISDTVGCVSDGSIIRTDRGLYFAALDGFYFTNGYEVVKISDELNDTYQNLVSTSSKKTKIKGRLDRLKNRCYWCVDGNDTTENDSLFVFDINFGVKRDGCFTTWNHESKSASFRPTDLIFIDNEIVRADSRGYLFQHNKDYYTDPKVDILVTASSWLKEAIIYKYTSVAFSFGSDYSRKWIGEIIMQNTNSSDLSMQISSANDTSLRFVDLVPVRYRGSMVWSDPLFDWQDTEFVWNETTIISSKRRMPGNSLRCSLKQIRITNADLIIATSDDLTTATADSSVNTVTLDETTNNSWPSDCDAYFIKFSGDSYNDEFEILSRTSDSVITVSNDAYNLVDASDTWKMTGKPKGELFDLLSYTIPYVILGDSQEGYKTSQAGDITT